MIKIAFTVLCFTLTPSAGMASDDPVGYILVPEPAKTEVEREGKPEVVIGADLVGEVLYSVERSATEVVKIEVFDSPSEESERLASVMTSGVMHELETSSKPGRYSFASKRSRDEYEHGGFRLQVFEKNGEWVKVKFRDQPPWNGRWGWIKIGNTTGGYYSTANVPKEK